MEHPATVYLVEVNHICLHRLRHSKMTFAMTLVRRGERDWVPVPQVTGVPLVGQQHQGSPPARQDEDGSSYVVSGQKQSPTSVLPLVANTKLQKGAGLGIHMASPTGTIAGSGQYLSSSLSLKRERSSRMISFPVPRINHHENTVRN